MTSKLIWLIFLAVVFIWSAINPHDRLTWWLEVAPVIVGFIVMAITHKQFPLTKLTYNLILLHFIVLLVGGHYTYANVPLFNDFKEWFDLSRNHYDKVGHLFQGFVPAIIARELFVRLNVVHGSKWLFFICVSVCLAISAVYEIIEWQAAVMLGSSADEFLGMQGYMWDTQSDMLLCGIGAILALILLKGWHDRNLKDIRS